MSSILRRSVGLLTVLGLLAVFTSCVGRERMNRRIAETHGAIIEDVHSKFSHIRVREHGRIRTLLFVEPDGEEVRQSAIHLDHPENLLLHYTRSLFATRLLRHPQDDVLIVGLGGGGMVQFINYHFKETHVDAIEIDPEVVRLAKDLFGTKPGPKTTIYTEDAFVYLERVSKRYDVIFMDAFLEPSDATGLEGIPLHLKTVSFLKSLHARLKPGGVVAFNLILNQDTNKDLAAIRDAFPTVYVFRVPVTRNLAVVASPEGGRVSTETLRTASKALDSRYDTGFSFEDLVDTLQAADVTF